VRSKPVSPSEPFSGLLRGAQAELHLPSASAAVTADGEVVWCDALGIVDVETGAPPTAETQYRVGSITKTFTAASVMVLRDEGKLGLDDRLSAHLPEAGDSPLTLRRMLAHLSGIQREVPGDVWVTFEFPDTPDELIARLQEAEQVLEPGAYWHYSNLAFALLGEVVTRVSGAPVQRFVEERFIGPLGLTRTSWLREEPAARGYYVDPWANVLQDEPEVERSGATAPAGDLWSTPADLCRWADFLAEREEMQAVQVMVEGEHWSLAWGLGLMLHRRGDRIFFGHDGAMPGFIASLAYSRKDRRGAAVLANASSPAVGVTALALDLVESALEAYPPEPEPWRPAEPPPPELEGVLGSWWSEGTEFTFRWRRGGLEAAAVGPARTFEPSVFEQEAADRYRTVAGRERGELLLVLRNPEGAVTELRWATYRFTRQPEAFRPLPS
jgi:CubicO group peptidase (beta-lactamase class C family)